MLEQKRARLEGIAQRLDDLNPQNILKRGYSITTKKATQEVLKKSDQVVTKERVRVKLFEGEIECIVSKVTPP
jgi:exodeoxyribonuclease VII large subunit